MNQLFLLKLIFDLLEDKPTKYKIDCAKKILKGMIDEYSGVPSGLPNSMVLLNVDCTRNPLGYGQTAIKHAQIILGPNPSVLADHKYQARYKRKVTRCLFLFGSSNDSV